MLRRALSSAALAICDRQQHVLPARASLIRRALRVALAHKLVVIARKAASGYLLVATRTTAYRNACADSGGTTCSRAHRTAAALIVETARHAVATLYAIALNSPYCSRAVSYHSTPARATALHAALLPASYSCARRASASACLRA